MTKALLKIEELEKRFGGVTASDHVSLNVMTGETHAIIGPNGAGKTTLVAQLSGQIRPDAGRIIFDDRDISHMPAYARAHVGIGRSFQVTSLFDSLTVLDNVTLAVQAHKGHSFRLWAPARSDRAIRERGQELLAQVRLSDRANATADQLSHGEKRQLEVAMALAGGPKLLMLDEPMAGMGPDESSRMVQTLKSLNGQTILLIEHDMDAVFALADRISVLVYGRIIATGTPDAVRQNEAVRQAYLGTAA